MRRLALAAAVVLATAAQAAEPVATRDALVARWAEPGSRFVTVDGARVHYVLEGSGEPVVLLNASFMGLQSWRPVAQQLAATHRVLRFDLPGVGLTGPDPVAPSIDRNVELLGKLTAQLGLDRFALVGTSSGGIVAFRFAAAHPERLTRLVLLNSAGMPRTAATNPLRRTATGQFAVEGPRSRDFWRSSLAGNFGNAARLPAWLVDLTYDLNRREGLEAEGATFLKTFSTGDPRSVLSRVTTPTFIMWGEANITVSPLEADVIEHWMTSAPTLTRKYAGVGHYPYVETPDPIARDLGDWLAGRLDGDLRITARLRPGSAIAGSAAP